MVKFWLINNRVNHWCSSAAFQLSHGEAEEAAVYTVWFERGRLSTRTHHHVNLRGHMATGPLRHPVLPEWCRNLSKVGHQCDSEEDKTMFEWRPAGVWRTDSDRFISDLCPVGVELIQCSVSNNADWDRRVNKWRETSWGRKAWVSLSPAVFYRSCWGQFMWIFHENKTVQIWNNKPEFERTHRAEASDRRVSDDHKKSITLWKLISCRLPRDVTDLFAWSSLNRWKIKNYFCTRKIWSSHVVLSRWRHYVTCNAKRGADETITLGS